MKHLTTLWLAILLIVVLTGGCSVWEPSTTYRAEQPTSFDVLDEYGWWVELPEFGLAWKPDVEQSWRPYTYGHWIWTDQGWYWAGYEPFAWIVYHYGYWYHDAQQGWFWLEGHEWSPSRVAWILGDDYVGWAPMPPPRATLIEPWQEGSSALWAYVPYSGFTHENPSRSSGGSTVRHPGDNRTPGVTHKGPEVKTIEGATDHKIPERHLAVREVDVEGRTWQKAELPADDAVRVQAHAAEVAQVVHKRIADPDRNASPARMNVERESVPVQSTGAQPAPTAPAERKPAPKQEPSKQKTEEARPQPKTTTPKAKAGTPAAKPQQTQKKDEPKQEKPKEASSQPDR